MFGGLRPIIPEAIDTPNFRTEGPGTLELWDWVWRQIIKHLQIDFAFARPARLRAAATRPRPEVLARDVSASPAAWTAAHRGGLSGGEGLVGLEGADDDDKGGFGVPIWRRLA